MKYQHIYHRPFALNFFCGLVLCAFIVMSASVRAVEVWNGPSMQFVRPPVSDWQSPTNQDRITPNVWIARNTTQGLLNYAVENQYTRSSSPTGTAWAFGSLSDYSTLTYTNWENWFGGNANGGPASTIGRDAVMHLLADDIYLAIRFDAWGRTPGSFAYTRSTQVIPEPGVGGLFLSGLLCVALLRHLQKNSRGKKPCG